MEDYPGLFSEVLQKKDHRYKLWVSKAEFQLRLKTRSTMARYCTGEDVVLDIIAGILCGRIKWDQERVPNINTFMHHRIRSYVSNLARKEHLQLCPYKSIAYNLPPSPKYVDADLVETQSLKEIQESQDLKELKELVLENLKDDVTAYFVFEEIIGGSMNRHAAQSLGIPVTDVVNAKKRIIKLLRELSGSK